MSRRFELQRERKEKELRDGRVCYANPIVRVEFDCEVNELRDKRGGFLKALLLVLATSCAPGHFWSVKFPIDGQL